MSDEHDSWFSDAFGLDIGQALRDIQAGPAAPGTEGAPADGTGGDAGAAPLAGVQDGLVAVKSQPHKPTELVYDDGTKKQLDTGIGDPYMLSPKAADKVSAPIKAGIQGAASQSDAVVPNVGQPGMRLSPEAVAPVTDLIDILKYAPFAQTADGDSAEAGAAGGAGAAAAGAGTPDP